MLKTNFRKIDTFIITYKKLITSQVLGFFLLCFTILFGACGGNDNGIVDDGYNREILLQEYSTWIQNHYESYATSLDDLKSASNAFTSAPDTTNLKTLKTAFLASYTQWQWLDFLNIEGAMENYLVETSNTFPADPVLIEKNIAGANTNLEPINQYAAQGFPAVDYLLFSDSTNATIAAFSNENRSQYLTLLVARLASKCNEVLSSWASSKETFVKNSGSDAGSSIALVFNAFVKNFERRTRDAKIGIPAGVRTDNTIQLDQVEALYSKHNLILAKENVNAIKSFFNCSDIDGFDNYLVYLNSERNGIPLGDVINEQLDVILLALNQIEGDLATSINTDKSKAINTFNEMQKLVIYLKVDMAAELGILINYADNDGDS